MKTPTLAVLNSIGLNTNNWAQIATYLTYILRAGTMAAPAYKIGAVAVPAVTLPTKSIGLAALTYNPGDDFPEKLMLEARLPVATNNQLLGLADPDFELGGKVGEITVSTLQPSGWYGEKASQTAGNLTIANTKLTVESFLTYAFKQMAVQNPNNVRLEKYVENSQSFNYFAANVKYQPSTPLPFNDSVVSLELSKISYWAVA
jgi:hypothetical protein